VYHRRYRTRAEAQQDIFEWIEVFYNRTRRHSTLGYRSPALSSKRWRDGLN
jgi:putative transposase